MFILFTSTVVLVGPAWCSYLCYVGAVDNVASVNKKRPKELPKWRHGVRIGILGLVVMVAVMLRKMGVPGIVATLVGAVFGLVGVGIMVFISRRMGAMTHCVTYCPVGLVANLMGKINPFRLGIGGSCTTCGACNLVCRYGALTIEDIKKRRPGLTCTLCGDCITKCHKDSIYYKFFSLKPQTARALFMVMVVSIHAVFLGVARI
ncbi:MAG: 4Fe-4S binding protein [bacterium]|nr:4Fe-4S binding protein [bacterium]